MREFKIINSEKERILHLHKTATKNYYLFEQVRTDGSNMKVSQAFWDHIKEYEGDPKNRVGGVKEPMYTAYRDSIGIWTIGYGHTSISGDPIVKPGMKITKQSALKILYNDALIAADCVRRIFSQWNEKGIKYKVTQGQFDALVSLVFNSGCDSVRMSDFIQDYKNGKIQSAAKKIENYKLEGGVDRRKKEALLFLQK
jgi:GH24 family phage-related lysozyme (muramidase)